MVKGILGKKVGMTQVFDESGKVTPVTIIEAGPCVVQAIKTVEKDGYNAIQIGFDDTKEKRVNKPQREYLKSKKLSPKKYVKEFRCDEIPEVNIGDQILADIFQKGDHLDISGISKGKGFQGGMKRHNWAGGNDTHGSMSHRAPGSIGQSSYPSRVFKGLRMAGQMGNEKVTVQHIEVVEVDKENATLAVKGAVPGANGNYVIISFSKKKPIADRIAPPEPEPEEEKIEETEAAAKETTDNGQQTTDQPAADEETTDNGQQTTDQPAADEETTDSGQQTTDQPLSDEEKRSGVEQSETPTKEDK